MAVITKRKLSIYLDNNLYDLIHNHFSSDESEHYIVTKLNNKSTKNTTEHQPEPKNNIKVPTKKGHHSASVILADANSTQINLDRNVSNSKVNNRKEQSIDTSPKIKEKKRKPTESSEPHPKLKIISGDPLPKEAAPIKEIAKTPTKNSIDGREKQSMEKATDKVIHKENNEQISVENSKIYNMIKESAATATLIEKTQVQVKLSSEIDNFTLKKIDLIDLTNSSSNYISLDHELFHLLGIVVIGKNLDIILFFRDGTKLQIAPANWVKGNNEQTKQQLINSNYLYTYTDEFDINQFSNEIHSISSYTSVNDNYSEYWIEFLPIQPSN